MELTPLCFWGKHSKVELTVVALASQVLGYILKIGLLYTTNYKPYLVFVLSLSDLLLDV